MTSPLRTKRPDGSGAVGVNAKCSVGCETGMLGWLQREVGGWRIAEDADFAARVSI